MTSNPFEVPPSTDAPGPPSRGVMLAAAGAWAAAVYWASLALFLGVATVGGRVSLVDVALPGVLAGLYGWRGLQVWQGHRASLSNLVFLHAIGAVFAGLELARNAGLLVMVLQGTKLAVNVLGGLAAWSAQRDR